MIMMMMIMAMAMQMMTTCATANTALATSWHHFTWPPPQHQAQQTHEASVNRYASTSLSRCL